eukprot:TRINITY_DN5979_c0_g3_i1.p1 TRINITY_DN5979_c0_g3~~TRINITY_DN5979_c0_g3_i1.p1  ORF type:complete len:116 (-),score=13.31 TRINITY_DN5979_c0_g3_i1:32-379(-)
MSLVFLRITNEKRKKHPDNINDLQVKIMALLSFGIFATNLYYAFFLAVRTTEMDLNGKFVVIISWIILWGNFAGYLSICVYLLFAWIESVHFVSKPSSDKGPHRFKVNKRYSNLR